MENIYVEQEAAKVLRILQSILSTRQDMHFFSKIAQLLYVKYIAMLIPVKNETIKWTIIKQRMYVVVAG